MVEIALSKLKPAPWNPRTIKDKRFAELCKSLEKDKDFLKLRPILATKDGTIYAGNMRYRAASHLGWETIPAVFTDISETLAKERAVKDNNQFGEWNTDELSTLVDELEKQGVDIETLGLDDSINKILQNMNLAEVTEDEAPAITQEPISKLGDLYQLGEHRLLCGDATKMDDVQKLMGGGLG